MKKFKLWLMNVLRKWLYKLASTQNNEEHQARLASVRDFFHATLPTLDEKWEGKAIIEGGSFNYFELPSGNLPKYDFVLPELPLYVCVLGVVSANWQEARERGIPRDLWEAAQLDIGYIQQGTRDLATLGLAAEPRLLVIRWDDSVNHLMLAERLEELIK